MKCIWKQYSRDELEKIVMESTSFMDVAKKLGYSLGGSYVQSIKQMLEYYHFNCEHFTGQGWNKDNYKMERFCKDSKAETRNLRGALIHLRGNQCEKCGLKEWNNLPITLEIHHIDGNKTNNELTNLQLLCPNCHSQTVGWRGRKK